MRWLKLNDKDSGTPVWVNMDCVPLMYPIGDREGTKIVFSETLEVDVDETPRVIMHRIDQQDQA